ncbi:unnamed protein product [Discosporangium mesarthrocarpum]
MGWAGRVLLSSCFLLTLAETGTGFSYLPQVRPSSGLLPRPLTRPPGTGLLSRARKGRFLRARRSAAVLGRVSETEGANRFPEQDRQTPRGTEQKKTHQTKQSQQPIKNARTGSISGVCGLVFGERFSGGHGHEQVSGSVSRGSASQSGVMGRMPVATLPAVAVNGQETEEVTEINGGEEVKASPEGVSLNPNRKEEMEAAKSGSVALFGEGVVAVEEEDGDLNPQGSVSAEWGRGRGVLSRRWRKRLSAWVRTLEIWLFLVHVLFKLARQKLVQKDEVRMSQRRRKLGRYLCKAFLKLGPTFIKIGQLLSTRVDLLSTEYIEELRRLQDDVPGFGGDLAVQIIEQELGAPVNQLFDSFNRTSLAAASLGQVHEAYLDGNRYAVKVQRPGLKDLFDVDLKSIGLVAELLNRFDPKLDGASRDWSAIFQESSRVLYEEVDYMREGRNAERFSNNFKNVPWVKAPEINWDRSTDKVLCMEFLEGIKISEVDKASKAGVNRHLLARRTAECYLAQLCRHGFFHCDPHPGNLACDAVDGGRIIFYDFGMMDELPLPLKKGLVNLIFGIYGNDVTEVCNSLEEMDIIRKGADRITVERVTRFYLGEFQDTLQGGGKYINQLDPEEERRLARRERAQIGQDLFSGQAAVPLQFPASFTFVFRAFTTLDGIGKTLDKDYDLTKIASPYLKELLDLKDGNTYVSVLKTWAKKLGWRGQDIASVVQSPRRVQHVDSVVSKLERGDLKLRVRVLESEMAFARMETRQGSMAAAVFAILFLNIGVLLGSRSVPAALAARAMFALSGLFGLQVPVGYLKLWQMKQQEGRRGFR